MEIFFELFFELFIEILGQILFELGLDSLAQGFRSGPKTKLHRIIGFLVLLFLGIIVGIIFTLIVPERIFVGFPYSGMSLLISPMCVGVVMHYFGIWKTKKGAKTTIIASFWGGAIMAFFVSLTRILIINNVFEKIW